MNESLDRVSIPRPFAAPSLALGPVEAFVLSKIDGRRTLGDLAVLVGLAEHELQTIVGRLAAQELVIVGAQAVDDEPMEGDRDSSRPTLPGGDPFARFDRETSPGEAPDDVLRAAGASTHLRR